MIKNYVIQDYIKAITKISIQQKVKLVKLAQVATSLNVSTSAVSDMVKKLVREGLIINHSHKGLELTKEGRLLGVKLIRHHRLWETFLHQVLGLTWDEIHDEAENLEHAASDKLIEKIDHFLNNEL